MKRIALILILILFALPAWVERGIIGSADRVIVDSANSTIDVAIQDQYTEIIDLFASRTVDTVSLVNNTSIDDTEVYIETTGSVPGVGNFLCLQEGEAFYQGQMLSVTSIAGNQYTIGLDSPLDYAFTNATTCSTRDINMAVDGSSTPIEFIVGPLNLDEDVEWDITRMIVHIQSTGTMDDGLFGDISALTKGVVFRVKNGTTKNIFNAKNNGDFAKRAYDRAYAAKAPAGKTVVTIRRSFSGPDKNGVTLRIKAADNGKAIVIVQDNLTALDHMHVVFQGHVVEQ